MTAHEFDRPSEIPERAVVPPPESAPEGSALPSVHIGRSAMEGVKYPVPEATVPATETGLEPPKEPPTDTPEMGNMPEDPKAGRLARLYGALAQFNGDVDTRQVSAYALMDGMAKNRKSEELQQEGMTHDEAANYIRATEGEHAPEHENLIFNVETLGLYHAEALAEFGLTVRHELFKDVDTYVQNADVLLESLQQMDAAQAVPDIREGFGKMVQRFSDDLPYTVMQARISEVQELQQVPFWMAHDVEHVQVEFAAAQEMEGLLRQGPHIADELERIGVERQSAVDELREVSQLERDDLLLEWSLAVEGGYLPTHRIKEDSIEAIWTQWWDAEDWDPLWRLLDHTATKSQAGTALARRIGTGLRDAMLRRIGPRIGVDPELVQEDAAAAYEQFAVGLSTAVQNDQCNPADLYAYNRLRETIERLA
jgi:hypothetical protein